MIGRGWMTSLMRPHLCLSPALLLGESDSRSQMLCSVGTRPVADGALECDLGSRQADTLTHAGRAWRRPLDKMQRGAIGSYVPNVDWMKPTMR